MYTFLQCPPQSAKKIRVFFCVKKVPVIHISGILTFLVCGRGGGVKAEEHANLYQ
jgi:hypothetical protein